MTIYAHVAYAQNLQPIGFVRKLCSRSRIADGS